MDSPQRRYGLYRSWLAPRTVPIAFARQIAGDASGPRLWIRRALQLPVARDQKRSGYPGRFLGIHCASKPTNHVMLNAVKHLSALQSRCPASRSDAPLPPLSWRCSASPRLPGRSRVPNPPPGSLHRMGTSDAERPFVRRDAEGPKVMTVVHRDEVAGGRPARTGHGEPVGMALRSQ